MELFERPLLGNLAIDFPSFDKVSLLSKDPFDGAIAFEEYEGVALGQIVVAAS